MLSETPTLQDWALQTGLRSEIARLQGRYRTFRKLELLRLKEAPTQDKLFAVARSCIYQGRLILALALLEMLLNSSDQGRWRQEVLRHQVLVARQMLRTPELHLVAKFFKIVDRKQRSLRDAVAQDAKSGQTSADIGEALAGLSGDSEVAKRAIEEMAETDSVVGILNYRVAEARASRNVADFRRIARDFRRIGATGDEVRTIFTQKAGASFTNAEAFCRLTDTQMAPIQYLRFIGARMRDLAVNAFPKR